MVRIRFTVNFQEAPLGTIPLSELGTRDSFATVLNPNKGDTFFSSYFTAECHRSLSCRIVATLNNFHQHSGCQ